MGKSADAFSSLAVTFRFFQTDSSPGNQAIRQALFWGFCGAQNSHLAGINDFFPTYQCAATSWQQRFRPLGRGPFNAIFHCCQRSLLEAPSTYGQERRRFPENPAVFCTFFAAESTAFGKRVEEAEFPPHLEWPVERNRGVHASKNSSDRSFRRY